MTWPDITAAERGDLLERARRRCFFIDVDDAGARLGRASMPYGIAKIHWMQQLLGVEADAIYIATPDSTITRNRDRWASGFGYGGALEWSGDLVPIELKPNCCGVLVAGLRQLPDSEHLSASVSRLMESTLEVDGPVPAHWDFDVGNHFINLYEVSDPSVTGGFPWVAVMHASGKELRGASEHGPGLYRGGPPTGNSLAEMAEAVHTPFGLGYLVSGAAAEVYREYVASVDQYAKRRRVGYARAIFGRDADILFNETHQGLDGPGRMLLGCYSVRNREVPWVPVTLRADLPAYLVAPGDDIYSQAALEREGVLVRATETGCLSRLSSAAVLPHGGGYAYPEADGGEVEVDDRGPTEPRRFRVKGRTPWFEGIRDLSYSYRGEEVIRRLENLECGRVVAQLRLATSL